jgi:hypothetical protein
LGKLTFRIVDLNPSGKSDRIGEYILSITKS